MRRGYSLNGQIQWEYKIIDLLNNAKQIEQLNFYGNQGWEVVAIIPAIWHLGNVKEYKVYLKKMY